MRARRSAGCEGKPEGRRTRSAPYRSHQHGPLWPHRGGSLFRAEQSFVPATAEGARGLYEEVGQRRADWEGVFAMNISDLSEAELIDLYCNVADQEALTELEPAVLAEIERSGYDN